MHTVAVLMVALLASCTGCLPLRVEGGPGASAVQSSRHGVRTSSDLETAQLRVGVHPLSLLERSGERRFDVGAGYARDWATADSHALYGEISYAIVATSLETRLVGAPRTCQPGETKISHRAQDSVAVCPPPSLEEQQLQETTSTAFRTWLGVQPRLVVLAEHWGFGAVARVSTEWSLGGGPPTHQRARTRGTTCQGSGATWPCQRRDTALSVFGEGALGAYLEAGAAEVGVLYVETVGIGLTFRFPLAVPF